MSEKNCPTCGARLGHRDGTPLARAIVKVVSSRLGIGPLWHDAREAAREIDQILAGGPSEEAPKESATQSPSEAARKIASDLMGHSVIVLKEPYPSFVNRIDALLAALPEKNAPSSKEPSPLALKIVDSVAPKAISGTCDRTGTAHHVDKILAEAFPSETVPAVPCFQCGGHVALTWEGRFFHDKCLRKYKEQISTAERAAAVAQASKAFSATCLWCGKPSDGKACLTLRNSGGWVHQSCLPDMVNDVLLPF